MEILDTDEAIGQVTELLVTLLGNLPGLEAFTGSPDEIDNVTLNEGGGGVNLFLYEVQFDPTMKNLSLQEGRPAPLWLVLKYLVTTFDDAKKSNSIQSHKSMGLVLRSLQELNFALLNSDLPDGLLSNPEYMKITFDEVSSELVSRIVKGSDDIYRFSMGFQVRPVMISTEEKPDLSLLVGVDYTEGGEFIGEEGIVMPVLPGTAFPLLRSVLSPSFEPGEEVLLYGENLGDSSLVLSLEDADLNLLERDEGRLLFVSPANDDGAAPHLSAGEHALRAAVTLPGGRKRNSNLLVVSLIPVVDSLDASALTPDGEGILSGSLVLQGLLLGGEEDDVALFLYRDRALTCSLRDPVTRDDQKEITFEVPASRGLEEGIAYRPVLFVNGRQARKSPLFQVGGA